MQYIMMPGQRRGSRTCKTAAYVCHVDRIGLYRLRHVDRIELFGHEHGRRWHALHHIAPGPS